MDPEEVILQKIQEMGYLTVTPLKIEPSYYNIDNGTILKVFTLVNAIHPNPKDPKNLVINSQDIVITFAPQLQHGPPSNDVLTQKQIAEGVIDEDVHVEPLRENFSVYTVSDGSTLSVKSVVGQVQKTKYHNREGEPIYVVSSNVIPKMKKSQNPQ